MSEQNKAIARQMWDALRDHDLEKMSSVYHEDVVYHGSGGEELKGRDSAIQLAKGYLDAFPDMTAEVEEMVAEGDFVVSRVRPSGTIIPRLNALFGQKGLLVANLA